MQQKIKVFFLLKSTKSLQCGEFFRIWQRFCTLPPKQAADSDKKAGVSDLQPILRCVEAYGVRSGFSIENVTALAVDVYLTLAAGNAQYCPAAGALIETVILTLTEAILLCLPFASALETQGEKGIILKLTLGEPARERPHKAENQRKEPEPA